MAPRRQALHPDGCVASAAGGRESPQLGHSCAEHFTLPLRPLGVCRGGDARLACCGTKGSIPRGTRAADPQPDGGSQPAGPAAAPTAARPRARQSSASGAAGKADTPAPSTCARLMAKTRWFTDERRTSSGSASWRHSSRCRRCACATNFSSLMLKATQRRRERRCSICFAALVCILGTTWELGSRRQ